MFGTIQVRLSVPDAVRDYLIHQCQQANNLTNCTLFQIRQVHFETCERVEFFDQDELYPSEFKTKFVKASYAELCKAMKDNPHYKMLGGQCAQQTIKSVVESFTSFNGLLKLFWQGEGTKPRMPHYRTKGGLAPLCYPAQAVQFDIETGQCRLPVSHELGETVKELFGVKEIWVNAVLALSRNKL